MKAFHLSRRMWYGYAFIEPNLNENDIVELVNKNEPPHTNSNIVINSFVLQFSCDFPRKNLYIFSHEI